MTEINAETLKKLFDDAREAGVFYPGLYEMMMMAYCCGVKRRELITLKLDDFIEEIGEETKVKKRFLRCKMPLGSYLEELKKDGELSLELPLFPRYYNRDPKKIYVDFNKVCLCTLSNRIRYVDIINAGMRDFFAGLPEEEFIMPEHVNGEMRNFFAAHFSEDAQMDRKYRAVAEQYGYKNIDYVCQVLNDNKKE